MCNDLLEDHRHDDGVQMLIAGEINALVADMPVCVRASEYLAYVWGNASASGVGSEDDPFVLGVRSVETGKERRLRLELRRLLAGRGRSDLREWSTQRQPHQQSRE